MVSRTVNLKDSPKTPPQDVRTPLRQCSTLDFYGKDGERIRYDVNNGAISNTPKRKTNQEERLSIRTRRQQENKSDDEVQILPEFETVKRKLFKKLRVMSSDEESDTGDEDDAVEENGAAKENATVQEDDEETESESDDSGSDNAKNDASDKSDGSESSRQNKYDTDDSFIASSSEDDENVATDDEYEPPDAGINYIEMSRTRGRRKSKNKRSKQAQENYPYFYDAQVVSIQRINLGHRALKKLKTEKVIVYIIQSYNHPKNEKFVEQKKPDFEYIEFEVDHEHQPSLSDYDRKLVEEIEKDVKEFNIRVFVQTVKRRSGLLRSLGIGEVSQTVHTVLFVYRDDEIFTITTNQAWNVVHEFADFSFPGKIAARVFSEKGKNESCTKGLVGTESAAKRTFKQIQESNPYDLLTYETSCTSEVRAKSSLLKFSGFLRKSEGLELDDDDDDSDSSETLKKKAKKGPNVHQGVKVSMTQSSLRIRKRLQVSDFLAILHHFSHICKGKQTTDLDGEIEKDSSAHKQYLSPVTPDFAKSLNLELSTLIHNGVASNTFLNALDNFVFCHKHFDNFFNGTEFFLKYKGVNIRECWKDRAPSVRDLVVALRLIDGLTNIDAGSDEPSFLTKLNKVTVVYQCAEDPKTKLKSDKLLNCIEGLIQSRGDNQVYWHVQAKWNYAQPSYLFLLHEQFLNILKDFLVPGDEIGLKFNWDPRDAEADPSTQISEYLRKYQKYTFVSQKLETDLVDMIRITEENQFAIYFVVAGLSHKTMTRGVHITNSILKIKKAIMAGKGAKKSVGGTEVNRRELKLLYTKVMQKQEFKALCPNFETFLKMMSDAAVVLVFGQWGQERGCRSLYEEKTLATKLNQELIQEKLENFTDREKNQLKEKLGARRNNELPEKIYNLLQTEELISPDGNLTSKFFIQTENHFSSVVLGNVDKPFYNNIIAPFKPNACPFLPKLELLRITREVHHQGVKDFKLVQLQAEHDKEESESDGENEAGCSRRNTTTKKTTNVTKAKRGKTETSAKRCKKHQAIESTEQSESDDGESSEGSESSEKSGNQKKNKRRKMRKKVAVRKGIKKLKISKPAKNVEESESGTGSDND